MPGVETLIPAALLVHLVAIATTLIGARRSDRWSRVAAFGGAALASLLTAAAAAEVLSSGQPAGGLLFVHAPSGLVARYMLTPLSAWFLLVLGLLSAPIAVYAIGYFAHAPRSRTVIVGTALNILLVAVTVVFAVDDAIGFLFAWELMTLSTAALVAAEHESRASRRAALLYLVMSHVGTGALVAGFFTLASWSGSTSFSAMLAGDVVSGPLRDGLFLLFLIGFGVKAGLIPLHIWLPDAHPAAPTPISALMSAVLITAGVYGLFRVCAFGLGTPHVAWGLACMAVGSLSAILGVLYALTQGDLKRLLAYSTIENAGIMLLGLGAGMTMLATGRRDLASMAVAASLFHVLNHAFFKGLLFLGAGNVVMATGTRNLESYGGLLRRMPWTGLFFLVGALAISGVPPFNGFVSEWLTFQTLLLGFEFVPGVTRVNFPLAGALLALTSALSAACFVKAFGIGFLAMPRSDAAARSGELPAVMIVPPAFLAAACLALGLFPGSVLGVLGIVTASLPGLDTVAGLARGPFGLAVDDGRFAQVTPLGLGLAVGAGVGAAALMAGTRLYGAVRRVPTWGCGGRLTPHMEYTAAAFSKPLLMVFRGIYRPTREVEALADVSPYFPQEVRYRVEIEPTFERHVYDPLVRGVMQVAERMKVLQAGSLHAYLGYVLLLGTALLVWLVGI